MRSKRQGTTSKAISGLLTLLLALLLVPAPAFAQVETGQIAGTVTDPQGAVVPGATVTVSSRDTGASTSASASRRRAASPVRSS